MISPSGGHDLGADEVVDGEAVLAHEPAETAAAFVRWHAGQLSWADATRDGRIRLHGPTWLVRAFPSWNGRSMFAHIKPLATPA